MNHSLQSEFEKTEQKKIFTFDTKTSVDDSRKRTQYTYSGTSYSFTLCLSLFITNNNRAPQGAGG